MRVIQIKTMHVPPVSGCIEHFRAEVVGGLPIAQNIRPIVQSPTLSGLVREVRELAASVGVLGEVELKAV